MKWLYAPRSVDYARRATRTEHLTANARAYVAYERLERHYWHCGRLYREDHELASAAGLTVNGFRRVKVLLLRLFDLDEAGYWRDYDLEAERVAAILALGLGDPSAYQAPAVAPAAQAGPGAGPGAPEPSKRSRANSENANARWARVRAARELAQGDAPEPDVVGGSHGRFASELMRNPVRIGMTAAATEDADRIGFASPSHAPNLEDEEDDSLESSSSSSTSPPRAASHAKRTDAISHRISHRMDTNADAKPEAGGGRAPAQPRMKDAELLDLMRIHTGDNIVPRLKNTTTVRPYRDLMAQGCDLELHIIPEWGAVKTLVKPMEQACPTWLRQQIENRRDAPSADPLPPKRGNPSQRVWVKMGSPNWTAWLRHYKEEHGRTFTLSSKRGDEEGWSFPGEWPPGHAADRVPAGAAATATA